MEKSNNLFLKLEEMYPNASCELNYKNIYQLLVAVILSAQTTDKRVNIVTIDLFNKYPDSFSLALAKINEVESIISSIGLAHTKANNIINMAKTIVKDYNGNVPNTFDELIKLPGVGRKTANVILSEGYKQNAIAVDTHVLRVSNRLGIANSNDPLIVEKSLQNYFSQNQWSRAHILLIFLGRYCCSAKKPQCDKCMLSMNCKYNIENDKKYTL